MTLSTYSSSLPVDAPRRPSVLHRWPSALGLAAAALMLATDPNREVLAITVAGAALCYLGAAASNRPWVAWAGIAAVCLVVTASELAGLPWWVGVGLAGLALVVAGLLGRVPRRALTAQTAALLGYGGLALAALFLAPRLGMVLAGVVLASHGVWDAIHYRRGQVVPRSLAEFCMLLDVPLGVGFVILAVTG